jgi:hypothetical protein
MTIPGLKLPGNLSIDDIIALFRNARETGNAVLEALREAVRSNPQLQALLKQFEGIFGKPVIELTDEELTNLIGSWHRGLTARSKDMVDDVPPPPPPPTGILDSDPGMQPFPKDVYVTRSTPLKYVIHSGTIGDPVPSQFSPPLPGVEEPGWHILHDSKRP